MKKIPITFVQIGEILREKEFETDPDLRDYLLACSALPRDVRLALDRKPLDVVWNAVAQTMPPAGKRFFRNAYQAGGYIDASELTDENRHFLLQPAIQLCLLKYKNNGGADCYVIPAEIMLLAIDFDKNVPTPLAYNINFLVEPALSRRIDYYEKTFSTPCPYPTFWLRRAWLYCSILNHLRETVASFDSLQTDIMNHLAEFSESANLDRLYNETGLDATSIFMPSSAPSAQPNSLDKLLLSCMIFYYEWRHLTAIPREVMRAAYAPLYEAADALRQSVRESLYIEPPKRIYSRRDEIWPLIRRALRLCILFPLKATQANALIKPHADMCAKLFSLPLAAIDLLYDFLRAQGYVSGDDRLKLTEKGAAAMHAPPPDNFNKILIEYILRATRITDSSKRAPFSKDDLPGIDSYRLRKSLVALLSENPDKWFVAPNLCIAAELSSDEYYIPTTVMPKIHSSFQVRISAMKHIGEPPRRASSETVRDMLMMTIYMLDWFGLIDTRKRGQIISAAAANSLLLQNRCASETPSAAIESRCDNNGDIVVDERLPDAVLSRIIACARPQNYDNALQLTVSRASLMRRGGAPLADFRAALADAGVSIPPIISALIDEIESAETRLQYNSQSRVLVCSDEIFATEISRIPKIKNHIKKIVKNKLYIAETLSDDKLLDALYEANYPAGIFDK